MGRLTPFALRLLGGAVVGAALGIAWGALLCRALGG